MNRWKNSAKSPEYDEVRGMEKCSPSSNFSKGGERGNTDLSFGLFPTHVAARHLPFCFHFFCLQKRGVFGSRRLLGLHGQHPSRIRPRELQFIVNLTDTS
ncbi:hypothetical protein CEXT_72361 [Caerostris extrusa]|uniref:Uncharacterized protein n=1 Tax=Caerostris extrusa TaxID=172846 RepID=A0AAV4M4I0_CAEEX|nr:hypothetical protein CEXT_72361 [Caerostris extrusa]